MVRDVIVVNSTSEWGISGRYRVQDTGSIILPSLGSVNVITRSPEVVREAILKIAKNHFSIHGDLQVSIETDEESFVHFQGAIEFPLDLWVSRGSDLKGYLSLLKPTINGDLSSAEIYLATGERVERSRLMPGDRVVIPVQKQVPELSVLGGVKQPGIVKINGAMTLKQAINAVGGLAPRADSKRIFLQRGSESGPYELDRHGDMVLRPADVIRVDLKPDSMFIAVSGGVKTPQSVELSEELDLLKAILACGGPMATNPTITIKSITNPKKKVWKCRWKDLQNPKYKVPKLERGDVIDVSPK